MGRDEMRGSAIFFLAILIMSLVGCATVDKIITRNRESLARLSLGMTKAEVLQTMGTKTILPYAARRINNPYRIETLKGKDGKMHEVLFYYTDIKKDDTNITDDELTPIVLTDGLVAGWGWSFLNANVTKYHYQIDIR